MDREELEPEKETIEKETIENQISTFLRENGGCDGKVPTLTIAKHFFGPKASKKSINKILYGMERNNLLVKYSEENGSKPHWSVKQN